MSERINRRDAVKLTSRVVLLGSGLGILLQPRGASAQKMLPRPVQGIRVSLLKGSAVLQEVTLPPEVAEALARGEVELRIVRGGAGLPEKVLAKHALPAVKLRKAIVP